MRRKSWPYKSPASGVVKVGRRGSFEAVLFDISGGLSEVQQSDALEDLQAGNPVLAGVLDTLAEPLRRHFLAQGQESSQEAIYDPRRSNDRLLLGLKGTLNEYELDLLRHRAQEARQEKAQRRQAPKPPDSYSHPSSAPQRTATKFTDKCNFHNVPNTAQKVSRLLPKSSA